MTSRSARARAVSAAIREEKRTTTHVRTRASSPAAEATPSNDAAQPARSPSPQAAARAPNRLTPNPTAKAASLKVNAASRRTKTPDGSDSRARPDFGEHAFDTPAPVRRRRPAARPSKPPPSQRGIGAGVVFSLFLATALTGYFAGSTVQAALSGSATTASASAAPVRVHPGEITFTF